MAHACREIEALVWIMPGYASGGKAALMLLAYNKSCYPMALVFGAGARGKAQQTESVQIFERLQ
jgi:hypothetical protein